MVDKAKGLLSKFRSGRPILNRILAAELTVVFIGWLTYVLFGAIAVSFSYDRSLIGTTQMGVPRPPVTHYVERADRLVLTYLAAALFLIVLQVLLSKLWRARRRSSRPQLASSSARLSSGRILLLRLLATAFGCLMAVGILIASNRMFVHRLSVWEKLEQPSVNELRFPNLNEREIMNLGWAHRAEPLNPHVAPRGGRHFLDVSGQRPRSSYLNHSMEKDPGTYRIGCFGDSFTEGVETASGHDYPSFLQEQLQATGGRKFEVINFGVGGYGMQQAFLMYEYLGRRYHLDAAIFMPFQFHDVRDNTFNYSGVLHARYVIGEDGFHLVTIDEKTRREALENYYSLLPAAKYWIYDAQSANLFSTFAAWGQAPRFNPFYYAIWRRYRSELIQLYSMMFGKAAEGIGKLIVVANDDAIESVANYKRPGVTVLRSPLVTRSFLLHAPGGHLSALGNQLRAAEISGWITGQKSQLQAPVISDSGYRPAGDEEILLRTSFAVASEGWIEIDGQAVAGFFQHNADEPDFKRTRKVDFRQQGIRGIIQLQAGEEPVFIPVDFPIEHGSPLAVRFFSRGTVTTVPIGTVDCVATFQGRARFRAGSEVQHMQVKHNGHDFEFVDHRHALVRNGYFEGMEVLVSDRPILRGQRRNQLADFMRRLVLGRSPAMLANEFELQPLTADYVYLRAAPGHYINLESISKHGSIEIRLRQRDGTVLRLGSYLQYIF